MTPTAPDPALVGTPTASHPTICPGLLETSKWDEADALRGEIHGAERLVEHACEIACAHGAPTFRVTAGPLRARFEAARARIREAYEILSRDVRNHREPSPAEEWLLDNSHVVEDQIREIQEDLPRGYLAELPRLTKGAMRGYPRVYALCLDYLRHTDARIDFASLTSYVGAYQKVSPFTIGELWAVPIMLRMGLVLTVGALAASNEDARDRARGDACGAALIAHGHSAEKVAASLAALDAAREPVTAALLVALIRHVRQHDAPLGGAYDWIGAQAARMHTTPGDLIRRQHLRQAADQVSVGNAITSMRAIGAFDWHKFFEQTSVIEAALRRDPSGDYAQMDDVSRDRYRHAIEDLARRSPGDESTIADAALELAERARAESPESKARSHIGYYLIGDGRAALEARARSRLRIGERVRRAILASPTLVFLGAILASTVAIEAGFFAWSPTPMSTCLRGTLALLLALPASEIAVSLVNALVLALFPPRLLPKLDFKGGVPAEHRTLVVVPALLDSAETLAKLLEGLEVRALANSDDNLSFALLTDWVDAPVERSAEDDAILDQAKAGVDALNAQYGGHRFALLHRHRIHNPAEGCWMGWERKRGKLEELSRLLRGAKDTSFSTVSAPRELLESVRYVITLDADTELPREVARRLIGAIAHPLNRPRLDAAGTRVVAGHGVIQPRVGTLPLSARRSRYARILAGPAGLDPYTTAVSDVYQDLFSQGSFVGKGIFDVDAFSAVLARRVPENSLLSHDLFEGIFARSALATDLEVLDEQPAAYAVAAGRQHRWIRGDWQLLPWLFSLQRGLLALDRWKLFDNLRRSLLGPALFAFCVVSWLSGAPMAAKATAILAIVFVLPVLGRLALNVARKATSPSFTGSIGGDFRDNARQTFVGLAFLLDGSLIALDAIARTLYRLTISRAHLLEWQTTGAAERQVARGVTRVAPRMWLGSLVALASFAVVVGLVPASALYAAPLVLLWLLAPALAAWLSEPEAAPDRSRELTASDRAFLRLSARKTWRFFETFVTADDHFLPPDNFQEEPRGALARRTSPTNIGLYLLSIVSARDFGFITLRELDERLTATIGAMEKLDRREGHVLNWYDTATLRPLEPQYVSTVDSGNLAAYLWTLREACAELGQRPIVGRDVFLGACDALRLATRAIEAADPRDTALATSLRALDAPFSSAIEAAERDPVADVCALEAIRTATEAVIDSAAARAAGAETQHWLERASALLAATASEVRTLAPFFERLATAPTLVRDASLQAAWAALVEFASRSRTPSALAEVARQATPLLQALDAGLAARTELTVDERSVAVAFISDLRADFERAQKASTALTESLASVGARALALADAMNFRFLFDPERELFAIGYNVNLGRLDASHYDLLASEARLGSLVAIAKGDAPQKHWFRLARPLSNASTGRALLSWSGSMFEFLMPLLVTKNCPDTLLHETYESVVQRQRAYGSENSVPWGISEAAYNVMDLAMTYQYRAFGVPGLGLKAGLGEDLVVAPYATALAVLVRPKLAVDNLRLLAKSGCEGAFGFYDSVDYTPSRVPPTRKSVVVKTFMAHHLGMSLLAFGEVLHGAPMQRRFHRDARVRATELLLEERIPARVPNVTVQDTAIRPSRVGDADLDAQENVDLRTVPLARGHLLGQGELSTFVTALGEGFTTWKRLDVTRFREDHALGTGGIFLYLRDVTPSKAAPAATDATDATESKRPNVPRVWSAGYQPTRVAADEYAASFAIDRIELRRRDGDIECLTEIVVSPELPLEIRRVTLTNHGATERVLDLTTYAEVVLAPRAADVVHPAFGNMFVQTEALPERGALLAWRRPKSPTDAEPWVVQALTTEGDAWEGFEFESSRANFLGRNGSTAEPAALAAGAALTGTIGTVLDPILALRRRVRIAPGAKVRANLVTGLASSRELALELLEKCRTPNAIPRTFELAWSDARVELRHLGMSAAQSHTFQRLLSFLLFPNPSLREPAPAVPPRGRGMNALWAHGISGDLPILAVRVDDPDFAELLHDVLVAHEFWRINGVEVDIVVLNEEPAGYLQPLRDAIATALRSSPAEGRVDQRGGVFLRRKHEVGDEDHALILGAARVVVASSRGSLVRQLRRATTDLVEQRPTLAPSRPARALPPAASPTRPRLLFDNGLGGFSEDGRDYVMILAPGVRTPAPWCNVIANASFGTLVSETGASFTWFGNSQRYRLTPWSNDAVADPSGELVYLRDDVDGSVWSPTPMPAGREATFEVRHGQGYTRFEQVRGSLSHALTVFVSPRDPVKLYRLRITNHGDETRRLSVFGVVDWVLANSRESSRQTIVTATDPATGAVLATNPLGVFPARVAFFGATRAPASVSGDRGEVFGAAGSRRHPIALDREALSGRVGPGFDPCGAVHVAVTLAPGEEIELALVLGQGDDADHARALLANYCNDAAIASTFAEVIAHWDDLLGAVTIKTPDPSLDLLVNRWLLYQVTSCRLWGRSAFYQSGGAFGFRDQLQDVLALIHTRPALAREHILRSAARQFLEGDVQHWWHPESGEGVRTRCSDDLLWLPFVTADYVRATGDAAILDVALPFLRDRLLAPADEDIFGSPAVTTETASLYEHCVRALERGATKGPHGLPLIGAGDWNDGMTRVGRGGTGESVWLAWFLAKTVQEFEPLAHARGDEARAQWCREHRAQLGHDVDAGAWDGAWYRRAYFDDGAPLGSKDSAECRIDAIAQSWAVIAGVGDPARARQALDESVRQLVRQDEGLMALLWPPFDRGPHDPGYLGAYPPGLRENGGQYTHGVMWTVQALALAGEGERAAALLSLLNPIHHGSTPEAVARYKVEPYVVTADVYTAPGHGGRGGWSWYTGSASWMYRIIVEDLLGVRREGASLTVDPRVPKAWRAFEITYRSGEGAVQITVENPSGVERGVARVEVDGELQQDGRIALIAGNAHRRARVVMGPS